jgi:hypothetical protein
LGVGGLKKTIFEKAKDRLVVRALALLNGNYASVYKYKYVRDYTGINNSF